MAIYDEPFADSSQLPMHLVCKAAREHVTVALSGDAGDELFAGYNRYFWGPRLWRRIGRLPDPLRQALSSTMSILPAGGWDALARPLGVIRPGEKLHKLGRSLRGVHDFDGLYLNLLSEWQDPAALVLGEHGQPVQEPKSMLDDSLPATGTEAAAQRMMYRDSVTYLPDDILCEIGLRRGWTPKGSGGEGTSIRSLLGLRGNSIWQVGLIGRPGFGQC